jgi:hypothetical protein
MLGVSSIIAAGLLLSFSVGQYSQFLSGNWQEPYHLKCGRSCNGTTLLGFELHFPNLLIAGLLSGSFGVSLLILKRQEIEG